MEKKFFDQSDQYDHTEMVIFSTNQEMRFYWVGRIRIYKETGRADSITG